MIQELTVENLAIIERAHIALGPGLTVLTGETGAGKSLLMDAIELVFGSRADSDVVRTGSRRASVAVAIDVSGSLHASRLCGELGVSAEDGTLFLQREVYAEGRSQCRVGGAMAPLAVLKRLGRSLVDLHGQHDHQSLLHPESHLGFLDAWIGEPANELRSKVAAAHDEAVELRRKMDSLREGQRTREHRLDLLRYQVTEIETLAPLPGESAALEEDLTRMRHAEQLGSAARGALGKLSDEDGNLRDQLAGELSRLEASSKHDPRLEESLEPIRAALYSLEDGLASLRAYAGGIDSDPERLEQAAERLDGLRRLFRKYGDDEAAVLAFLEQARTELDWLVDSDENLEELQGRLSAAEEALATLAAELSALRNAKSAEFCRLVQVQLGDLAMEGAEFHSQIGPKPPDATGADALEFLFSANAGEPPRQLAKIASGGEISRVMLAIKSVMAGRAGVPTLVFDEVDAGLGGRAAAVVGRKLEELARHHQVIVISHLPQIASRAVTHFRISKRELDGRVVTRVEVLRGEDRVAEIARMIAGEEVGETALVHAREMLSEPLVS